MSGKSSGAISAITEPALIARPVRNRRLLAFIVGRPDTAAVALFAILAVAFCWRYIVGGVLLPTDALYTAPPWNSYAAAQGVQGVHNELIADLVLQNYSWKSFIADSYRSGQFPLWNPYLFAGTPFLAAGQYAALYPLGFLFLVLPVASAYGPFAALHLFLAGAFTYLYLRVIGTNRAGALVGAVTFEFSGFLVVSFVWPMILSAAVWLPLGLAMCELVAQNVERGTWNQGGVGLAPRARFVVPVGALTVGLQLLAGHLEISFYFLFTLMVYSAFRLCVCLYRTRRLIDTIRGGFGLLVMVGVGFLLAGAQLVPFFELIRENYRIGQVSYQDVIGWALPKQHLLAWLVPDVFGNPTHHSYFDFLTGHFEHVVGSRDAFGNVRDYPFWGIKNYVEGAVYVGVLPLVLGATALLVRRDRFSLFFSGFFFFCLVLAFGTPLYQLVWLIPGVNQLHTPFRWVFPATFSLAALAGLGASCLADRVSFPVPLREAAQSAKNRSRLSGRIASRFRAAPHSEARSLALGLFLVCLLGGAVVLSTVGVSRLFVDSTLGLAERLRSASSSLALAFPSSAALYSYEAGRLFGVGVALLVAAAALMVAWKKSWLAGPFLAAAIFVDLFVVYADFNTSTDPRLLQFVPPAIQAVRQDGGLYRVVSFNYDDTLRPNSGMLFGLQDIRGYDTVIQRRFVEYWRLLEEPSGLLYSMINKLVDPRSLQSPLLDLLGVKYVLTTQNIGLPGWTEVYRGEINVYRNERALPRAFVVGRAVAAESDGHARTLVSAPDFDPRAVVVVETDGAALPNGGARGSATIGYYSPNRVDVDVVMDAPGVLVLADSDFAGWRATVDDRETPIFRANALFRSVVLPAGTHRVQFRYSPFSFQIGGYLSLIGLFAIALGLGYAGWAMAYEGRAEGTTVQRIFKNSLAPMVTQLSNRLVDLAFAVVVARLLGPAAVGEYAFAIVLIGYFLIFTDFGLGTLLTREVARDREQAKKYLATGVGLRLALSVGSLPVIASIVLLYWSAGKLTPEGALTIAFFTLSLFPGAISAAYSTLFYAFEKMEYPALLTSVSTILKVALGLAVLFEGWGIAGLGAVSVVVNSVTALVFWRLLSTTFFRPEWRFDTRFAWNIAVLSFPLMINNFLSSLFFRIDVLMLKPMQGDAVTGYYSTAYKFIDGLNFIPSLFTLAIFPIFARYAASSTEALRIGFLRSLKVLLIVSIPITVGTTLLADGIVLLFFGEPFSPSIQALQVLIWFLPFSYINSVTHYVLIALNRQRFLTVAFVIGVAFNVTANWLLIPRFGLAAASAVTVVSEVVLLVPFFIGIKRHLGSLPPIGLGLRPLAASLVMGGVVWWARGVTLWPVAAVAGAFVYVLALVLVGGLDGEDYALIRRLVGSGRASAPLEIETDSAV